MFNQDFDPYEILLELQERQGNLENAHNRLAQAFQITENELTQTMLMLRALQKHHLELLKEHQNLKKELGK